MIMRIEDFSEDELWMWRAVQLARNGVQGAPPNPMVGAVIVCDGRIIGEGYHRKCGEGHAEVNAFASVRDEKLLSRSRMYVTLEPCSHYGKTPPCAKLIIEKGVKEVYVGCVDPFAQVSGRGIRMLEDAGVKVTVGILENECKALNAHFFTNQLKHRPYVLLKWAQSADGKIDKARQGGTPARLSSSRSLLRVHGLRTRYQAIMVGTHTALLDNPRLTARLVDGPQPLRVVLDRKGCLPDTLHLFDGNVPTLVFGEKDDADRRKTCQFCPLDYSAQIVPQMLSALQQRHIQALMVEGGAKLLQSFLDEGCWDEIQVEQSDVLLGDGVAAPVIPPAFSPVVENVLGTVFFHYYSA